jgi:iron complex transport system substrate-binding protein
MLVISACGSKATNKQDKEIDEATEVKVKHELDDEEVVLKKNPEKIVVMDFGVLDTLDELDVEVAGVPQDSMPGYLEEYKGSEYTNVGSVREPDFEAIHALEPDLIIIGDRQAELYEEFKEIAPTVYMVIDFTDYMDSFTNNMETIAKIFNKEEHMEKELAEVHKKVDMMKERTADSEEKTLIVMVNQRKISAYGPGSRYGGFIHDVAGFKPADEGIEKARYGQIINFEYIMEKEPDIIFVIDRDAALNPDHAGAKKVIENEFLKKTNAYKNNNVFYLNMDAWFFGGGLQSTKMMIKDTDVL